MPNKSTYKIYNELTKIQNAFDDPVYILENLPFKQKDKIKMIEHYTNSKYLLGMKDELGRDKPFFNILNGIIDVENAAKDLDTSDIKVESIDGNHYQESFLLGKDLAVWMNENNFGKFLNDLVDTHSRYGSVLVKRCIYIDEKGEKNLKIELPAWKNISNDQVNLIEAPVAETHWMLPSDLLKKKEWKNQTEAIKYSLKNDKNKRRVPVYELRGEFPRAYYKEMTEENYTVKEEDMYDDYSYQLYYLAGDIDGKLFCLYSEDDTEKDYKYLARKVKPGRAFGVGIPEEGEEAQIWTNDTVLKQYRAMEYTSKVVGQTATKKLRGRNMLTEVLDGQILEHDEGKPITSLQLLPPGGLQQYQSLLEQWYNQFEKASSAYGAQRGETPPSHTPFRLQALVLQQSHSIYDQLHEQLGILVGEIINDWVLPFLAKKLSTEHILAGDFTAEELKEIDKNFATREANNKVKEKILSGNLVSQEEYDQYFEFAKEAIGQTKDRRFLKIPKNYYKDLKAKAIVDPTGEKKNKAAVLESLSNIMMVYMKNPQATQDPVLSLLFKQILELSGAGISPVQFQAAINEQAKQIKEQMEQQREQLAVTGGQGGNPPAAGGLENSMVPKPEGAFANVNA